MNRQTLSFTYNFDTSHLNSNNATSNEPTNQEETNTYRNTLNSNLGSSNSLFSLPPITNFNSSTSSLNGLSNNNLSLSSSNFNYGTLSSSQSTLLPPLQYSNQYNNLYNNQHGNKHNNQYPNQYNNQYVPQTTPQIHTIQQPERSLQSSNPLLPNRTQTPINNPLLQTPSSPSTLVNPSYSNMFSMSSSTSSLMTPSLLNNPLNGLGAETFADLGGEENDELKKMNLNHLKDLIPEEETQTDKKDTEDDYSQYDYKEPTMQNVISTFSLDCKLDLQKIQKKARNTEYHPKRFAALVMRIKQPQTTALIFSSGKVVVTGAKNESESKLACKKFARVVKKLDFPATFKDFKVQNIVASCEVGYKVSLESLVSSEHANSCRFEPELFPGLIYKMIEPKVTLLIFVSGKIVITGAKTKNAVELAFKNISPVLINFKK